MNNAELITALRCEGKVEEECLADGCKYFGDDGWCDERKMALDAADALEAAEKRIAELMPKEGEWIEDDTTYAGADRANYKCSLCGKIGGTWKRGLTQDKLPNFCPNCGAKMRKGEQE